MKRYGMQGWELLIPAFYLGETTLLLARLTRLSLNSIINLNMRPLLFLLITLLLFACSQEASVFAATTTIRLSATPNAIYSDGKSVCTISAEVRDSSGRPVPDGSQVRFSSSLGVIDTTVDTVAGVARAILRSGTQPGIAMVSAVMPQDQAVSQIEVEFLPPGASLETDAFITVSSGQYVAYAADTQIVDATGRARAEHRGLTIEADEIQVDVPRNLLRAKTRTGGEDVQLTRGSNTVTAHAIVYDLSTQRGFMLAEGEDGRFVRLALRGSDLTTTPADDLEQSTLDFTDLSDTSMLVKAKSITVRPRHDIQFRRAEVYLEGQRILKLPLYLLPLTGRASSGLQFFGVTSAGLRVDIPVYFSLSPSGAGAVRIRNQQGGWSSYSSLPGWAIDLERNYATGSSEGKFTVGQVNRKDWGIDWQHTQQLADARLHTYLAMPAHRDIYGMLNFNKPLKSANLGLNLRGQKPKGMDAAISSDLYLQTHSRQLTEKLRYSVALRSSLSNQQRIVTETVGQDQIVTQRTERYGLGTGLQLQMYSSPLSLGGRTSLTNSLSVGHDWGGLRSGLSMYGNSMLMTSLGSRGNLALGYTYTRDAGLIGNYGHHRLSANYMAYGDKWRGSLSAVHTLDEPITSAYGSIGYQIRPDWRIDLRGTYQSFQGFDFSDMEVGVARLVGSQEIGLTWSQSLKKFRIDIGAFSF